MLQLTPEQQHVVAEVVDSGSNVACTAVAGAGKTTLLVEICRRTQSRKVLICAYNRALCSHLRQQIWDADVHNVTCLTFHALCTRYFGAAWDDDMLHDVLAQLDNDDNPPDPKCTFDLILLDEMQDFRPAFARLMTHLQRFNTCAKVQYVLVGDSKQMLYDFYKYERADTKYLTCPSEECLLGISTWVQCQLTQTFRLPVCIAEYTNTLTATNIVSMSTRKGSLHFRKCPRVEDAVKFITACSGNLQNDCLLLSCKRRDSQFMQLCNLLTWRPTVSTFCSAKGLQTKCAVVFANKRAMNRCSVNSLHVALTRATDKLIIVSDFADNEYDIAKDVVFAPQETARINPTIVDICGVLNFKDPQSKAGLNKYYNTVRTVAAQQGVFNLNRHFDQGDDDLYDDFKQQPPSDIYLLACLMKLEYEYSGRCARLDQICGLCVCPKVCTRQCTCTRTYSTFAKHVASHDCRVQYNSNSRLPRHIHEILCQCRYPKTHHNWCFAAVCVYGWNDYHYKVYDQLPVEQWFDDTLFIAIYNRMTEVIRDAVPEPSFDSVHRNTDTETGTLLHGRSQVYDATRHVGVSFELQSEISRGTIQRAAAIMLVSEAKQWHVSNLSDCSLSTMTPSGKSGSMCTLINIYLS